MTPAYHQMLHSTLAVNRPDNPSCIMAYLFHHGSQNTHTHAEVRAQTHISASLKFNVSKRFIPLLIRIILHAIAATRGHMQPACVNTLTSSGGEKTQKKKTTFRVVPPPAGHDYLEQLAALPILSCPTQLERLELLLRSHTASAKHSSAPQGSGAEGWGAGGFKASEEC